MQLQQVGWWQYRAMPQMGFQRSNSAFRPLVTATKDPVGEDQFRCDFNDFAVFSSPQIPLTNPTQSVPHQTTIWLQNLTYPERPN